MIGGKGGMSLSGTSVPFWLKLVLPFRLVVNCNGEGVAHEHAIH